MQYSAIGIALVFCIKKVFFYELSMSAGREGHGPLICFSTNTHSVKTIQLSPTIIVLCCTDQWR